MARAYDVRTVALTLGVPNKWVDNLLSHHQVHGVSGGRQGVQRSISPDGLIAIELTWRLTNDLQLPVRRAAEAASEIVANRGAPDASGGARIEVAEDIHLVIDVASIEASLRERLLAAVESTARPTRGRPRKGPPS